MQTKLNDYKKIDAFLFDLDGTIYVSDRLLPGVRRTLNTFREQSKSILFISNTTIRTREAVQLKLQQLGIACTLNEVLTAAYAAGLYFQEKAKEAIVFVVGESALELELVSCGVTLTSNPLEANYVLVGLDREFNYEKLTLAMQALRNGSRLIAVNPDPYCPSENGVIPDTWSIVKALEVASQSQTYYVIGKPSLFFADKALRHLHSSPQRCLIIGDRLDTDIQFGINSGMRTALVLTGANTREDIAVTGIVPNYVLQTLSELIEEAVMNHG
jgi:HAD superfamily hydrolase (TIGR01457 family)